MSMPKNVGEKDRTLRLILATVLIIVSFIVGSTSAQILLTLAALVLLYTSYTRTCLAYIPLKMDTTKGE
jgi:hypothetical protein